jgi:hypothetical protein
MNECRPGEVKTLELVPLGINGWNPRSWRAVKVSYDCVPLHPWAGKMRKRCSIGGRIAIFNNEIPPLLLLPYLFD